MITLHFCKEKGENEGRRKKKKKRRKRKKQKKTRGAWQSQK